MENTLRLAAIHIGGKGNCVAYALSIARSALGYDPPVPESEEEIILDDLNKIIAALPRWFPHHTVRLWVLDPDWIVTGAEWPRNVDFMGYKFMGDDAKGMLGYAFRPAAAGQDGHFVLGLPANIDEYVLMFVLDIV
jgi:hypothetical protein